MAKLESALLTLNDSAGPSSTLNLNAKGVLALTILYLFAVLSVPLQEPQKLVWLGSYPVIVSEICGCGFARIFLKSLWILPLVLAIGMFNPIYNTAPALNVYGIEISKGWISFLSILLRGLLSFQAALLLIRISGFYRICDALRKFGCPRVLAMQLLFTYRYMIVLTEEALSMDRARRARGFGEKHYSLRMWGEMIGQLLIRTYDRASRIHKAMLARGFTGNLPLKADTNRKASSPLLNWAFFIIWAAVIIAIRWIF